MTLMNPVKELPNPLVAATYISDIGRALGEQGIEIRYSTDFSHLHEVCHTLEKPGGVTEPFSRDFFDFTPKQAFWLSGQVGNEVMHVQAVRCDDLEGISLADYWRQQLRRIHCDDTPGELDGRTVRVARHLTGRIAFHGNMWIAPDWRGQRLPTLLSRLALATALWRWEPDVVYGFVAPELVAKGFQAREGYAHQLPNAVGFRVAPPGIDPADHLVWMTSEDLLELIDQPLAAFWTGPARRP